MPGSARALVPPDESSPAPARFAVMLSGGGRTLANLFEHIEAGRLRARVVLVIASRECPGADLARRRGVRVAVQPGEIAAEALAGLLTEAGAEWIVLAGYLRQVRVPPGFDGRIVNIHPALLPSFGGAGMYGLAVHQAVLDAGCKVSGCTVHLCDAEYDRGPIVLQRTCPVEPGDTAQTLADRVFKVERRAYPDALELLFSGRVRVDGRRTAILPDPAAPVCIART